MWRCCCDLRSLDYDIFLMESVIEFYDHGDSPRGQDSLGSLFDARLVICRKQPANIIEGSVAYLRKQRRFWVSVLLIQLAGAAG